MGALHRMMGGGMIERIGGMMGGGMMGGGMIGPLSGPVMTGHHGEEMNMKKWNVRRCSRAS